MPGKDEIEVENQEPTNQESEQEETKKEAEPEHYEERTFGIITGVMGSGEE